MTKVGRQPEQLQLFLVADRAYEGNETLQLAADLGYTPVIPPKSNRNKPWDYDPNLAGVSRFAWSGGFGGGVFPLHGRCGGW